MVTGASTADVAVILIDARKGVLTQTRRHSYLVSLLGIKPGRLAVNKLDLVGYSQERFNEIVADYLAFAASIGLDDITASRCRRSRATTSSSSANTPWYTGPTLIEYLENVEIEDDGPRPRRSGMPVQWVNRPDLDFRGFSGLHPAAPCRPGIACASCPPGIASTVDAAGDRSTATCQRPSPASRSRSP